VGFVDMLGHFQYRSINPSAMFVYMTCHTASISTDNRHSSIHFRVIVTDVIILLTPRLRRGWQEIANCCSM